MDAPAILYALRWLIHDTFRQALTSRVFWIMLGLSGLCILFCLGVSVEGGAVRDETEFVNPKKGKPIAPGEKAGELSLLFGAVRQPFPRTAEAEVEFLMSIFASWVAGVAGLLTALVWTAGFVPESLQPSAASVLLAKPAPRWLYLTGKYLGVVCFVALHAAIFFLGTFFALGIKTGIWHAEYLLGIPLLIFQFALVFSFVVLTAVLFRSTMACVIAGVLFWMICFAINYGRHYVVVFGDETGLSHATVFLADVGYWILPKPVDITILLERSMHLSEAKTTLESQQPFARMIESGQFHPIASILTSCLFPIFALWAAASQLANTDY
jgi:ABC-type transport system involved in multi-copper enzyme maturation permease subunit